MLYNILIFIIFSFIFCDFSYAAEEKAPVYGLAMHGAPKYNKLSTHLDYANPDAPKGGTLKMAAIGSFDTLNPYTLKGTSAQGLNLVYDRLMARVWDEPFSMYPLIAEDVDIPEDRSSITVHINPHARFNDSTPVTAYDVIYSFETLRDHGRPNMRRIYKLVDKVERLDLHTVKFSLGEGYDRETVMIIAMMPVLSKKYWGERNFENTILEPPLTNGPYKIKSVDPGRSITYERNPSYWAKDLLPNAGHYNFDEVTYDYFRDDTVALEAFNKGTLNFRRENDIAKWMSAYSDSPDIIKYEAAHQRPERARGLIFNLRRAPFDDINVRKAIALAFDEEWIGQNIFYGNQKRIRSLFPNSTLSGESKTPPAQTGQRRTLQQAAALLDQAGWEVINNKRVKNGKELRFELALSAPEEEKIALNLKKHLERLGVQMHIRVLDSAAFQKRRNDYDYDMILHHWQNSLSPGTEQMIYWSCEAAKQNGRFNFAGICSEEIDALAASIANAKTYDELTAKTRQLDQILMDSYIFVPLFYSGVDLIAHDKSLKHTETVPIYGSVAETWWMETPAQ